MIKNKEADAFVEEQKTASENLEEQVREENECLISLFYRNL